MRPRFVVAVRSALIQAETGLRNLKAWEARVAARPKLLEPCPRILRLSTPRAEPIHCWRKNLEFRTEAKAKRGPVRVILDLARSRCLPLDVRFAPKATASKATSSAMQAHFSSNRQSSRHRPRSPCPGCAALSPSRETGTTPRHPRLCPAGVARLSRLLPA